MSAGVSATATHVRKRVLLIVHTRIFFPRMLELGHALATSTLYDAVFHFAYKSGWTHFDADIAHLERQGFGISAGTRRVQFRRQQAAAQHELAAVRARPSFRLRIKIWLKRQLGTDLSSVLSAFAVRLLHSNLVVSVIKLRRRLVRVRALLHEERPDIVVMSSDVPTWDTGAYIRCCCDHGIPTVVAFSQTGPLDEAAYVCSQKWHLNTALPLNFLLSNLYPKWSNQHNGKSFLMMGFGETLAKEMLDVSMPQPWIESSSNADAVLIENDAYYQRGLRAGLVANNLYVTGYPFHDVMHHCLANRQACRDRVRAAHGLQSDKPLILTSLLPNYASRKYSDPDFPTYEEMVSYWIQTLSKYDGYHTIVSLHPTQPRSEFAYIEDMGATIACLPMPEIMPACHIYVASLSSTITMAEACGIPVVNYDYAHYGNTHYADAPGVIEVTSRAQFERALDNLLCNSQYHAGIAAAQAKAAPRWGRIDGKAGERILGLFDGLISGSIPDRMRPPSDVLTRASRTVSTA